MLLRRQEAHPGHDIRHNLTDASLKVAKCINLGITARQVARLDVLATSVRREHQLLIGLQRETKSWKNYVNSIRR